MLFCGRVNYDIIDTNTVGIATPTGSDGRVGGSVHIAREGSTTSVFVYDVESTNPSRLKDSVVKRIGQHPA